MISDDELAVSIYYALLGLRTSRGHADTAKQLADFLRALGYEKGDGNG